MSQKQLYALNLDGDGRVLSVTFDKHAPVNQVRVESFPKENTDDYLFINNEFVYSPRPKPEESLNTGHELESIMIMGITLEKLTTELIRYSNIYMDSYSSQHDKIKQLRYTNRISYNLSQDKLK